MGNCFVDGSAGRCIDVLFCASENTASGLCPGSAAIKCCLPCVNLNGTTNSNDIDDDDRKLKNFNKARLEATRYRRKRRGRDEGHRTRMHAMSSAKRGTYIVKYVYVYNYA